MSHNSHDDDDQSLFRRMMKDVKPLKQVPKEPRHHTPKQPVVKKYTIEPAQAPQFFLSDPYDCTIGPETILSFNQYLSLKRFKQLKQGEIPIEGKLDLHGLRLPNAKTILARFIMEQYQRGHRTVLIIHGKGGVQNDIAILKSHVNHWLKQIPEILAFHSARPQHGGTGAVYVLLKANSDPIYCI